MAGDWLKMRGNLWDDPRVNRLCDLTDSTKGPVIGALYWLWATADQHTEDGFLPGLTLRQIDRKTALQGFGAALCEIGWLQDGADGVTLIRFEEHNGASAKRRCTDAQRKASVRVVSASNADKQQTQTGQPQDEIRQPAELEKRREESNTPPTPKGEADPAGFAAFWEAWPSTERKSDRKKCAAKWRRCSYGDQLEAILAHVEASKATRKWREGFDPAPLTYLNGERGRDGVTLTPANPMAALMAGAI